MVRGGVVRLQVYRPLQFLNPVLELQLDGSEQARRSMRFCQRIVELERFLYR